MSEADRVRRRQVFFVNGFDPKGAAYFHHLYRTEAARQGAVTGVQYEVGARRKLPNGDSTWDVSAWGDEGRVATTYRFARWDDIVRQRWPRTSWGVFAGSVRAYVSALASGRSLVQVWRAAPKTIVSLAYPAAIWLMLLAAWVLFSWAAGRAAGWPAGVVLLAMGPWLALRWERRAHTTWLLRIYQFAADGSNSRVPGLDERIDAMAASIREALRDTDVDEVLVVGFSVGSILAASAVARAAPGLTGAEREKLGLMTLGHCIPLVGLMPNATRFRAELASLAHGPRLRWVDFSSPTDWGSFALVDPVALCTGEREGGPVLASPRFHQMFEAGHYLRLRRDKRRMHMQYLMAGELRGDYDFFALTAGPERLHGTIVQDAAP